MTNVRKVQIASGLVLCLWAQQSPAQQTNQEELRAAINALKSDVNSLKQNQEQIANELKELKRLLEANFEAPPTIISPRSISIAGELFRGARDARIVMIEYGDFECEFRELFGREIFPQIFANYISNSKLKFVYRDLTNHPRSLPAARAAHCAGDQGKFWEMHASLLDNQAALSDEDILSRASALALNSASFTECFSGGKYSDVIQKSTADARTMGIAGTPTFLIGIADSSGTKVKIERTIIGAQSYDTFKSAIDGLLTTVSKEQR